MHVPGKLLRTSELHRSRFNRWCRRQLTYDRLADVAINAMIFLVSGGILYAIWS